MFTILPTIEDADTTCPKDTTASSRNKPGLPGTPASPWARQTPRPRQGHPDPRALQVRQAHGTRQALSRRWTSSTGSPRRRHGHHLDQLRQQRSRQHHPRQRITNRYQLQLGKPDPTPDNTLATPSVLGQVAPAYLQALQEPESPPRAIRQAGMRGRRCCPPDPAQRPNGHASERPVWSGQPIPGTLSTAQNAQFGESIGHRGIRWATDHIGGSAREPGSGSITDLPVRRIAQTLSSARPLIQPVAGTAAVSS